MEIRSVLIGALREAEYNPRVSLQPGMAGYERLKRSLDEFGLVQPIVWNERTGHVVGGHQRLTILRDQGVESVEVVVVSLNESREKALNVTLNNSRVGGDWDAEKLLGVMEELHELPDFDETLTGFDADDVRDLLLIPEPELLPEEEEAGEDVVRVSLEISPESWEEVEPAVNQLVQDFGLRTHIKLP